MEGGDQELGYACKLCNKRCPCAKSLGGHMRWSHHSRMSVNSAESEEKFEPNMKKLSSLDGGGGGGGGGGERDSGGFELGGQSGYGLRENPRKTWKAVDSVFPLDHDRWVCKQCGKGFQSLKALCGHMACHSEKERVLKDDFSWIDEDHKVVMDGQSDTEAENPRPRKRRTTSSKRYKRIVVKSDSVCLANGSSSVSEIEQEQEELALCLMMLSRDSGNWGGLNESSDNNSVVLETKSSSIDMGIGKRDYVNCVYNGDGTLENMELKGKKLKFRAMDAELVQFENSDSGYFRNGAKKVESDVSDDGFLRNDEYKKPKVDGKGFNRLKFKGNELKRKGLIKEEGYGEASNPVTYDSKKRFQNGSYNNGSSNVEKGKNAQRRSKYESCSNKNAQDLSCNAERRFNPKKIKGHECSICFRVFKSGQALGGHKRSHFNTSSEDRSDQAPVINEELPEFHDLLDLNLPAPIE
ncbi:uncharacterized protein LOC132302794 [Cornus florida]|uniref:uncharacterized protein LOC132302794 n=1 Tax=Cornus florida TaxID=4283 RepID=UPI0028A00C67|nr:uncharacterized protein LOC132302794 [Cornus florida]